MRIPHRSHGRNFAWLSPMRYTLCAALAATLVLIAPVEPARAGVAEAIKAIVAGNYALAEKELRADADNANAAAQVMLGRVQREPRNPGRNTSAAFAWFQLAADAGNAEARYWMGLMAHRGEGTTKDVAQALAWWRHAAEAGYGPAMSSLASIYASGSEVEKDMAEAVRWARAGAAKHEMVSQSILGRAYMLGEGGLVRDFTQFMHWTRLAALQGERNAQAALGRLYLEGAGVPQDYVQAHLWFNLAAARGHSQSAKQRDEVAAKMAPQQLADAQKLASAWRPARSTTQAKEAAAIAGSAARRTGSGSGFVVDASGNILTNYHVVRGCGEVRIPAYGAVARVAAFDERNDLALLDSEITAEALPVFRAGSNVRLGESIIVAGFPLGEVLSGGLNVTTGSVSALAGPRNNAAMLQITAPIQAGNSGGPVLDQSGLVVGVVVSKLNALRVAAVTGDVPQNVNFAVNGMIARAFLAANGAQIDSGFTTPAAVETVDVAERAKRYTVMIECWR
jgi:TPR repeat protein